MGIEIDMLLPSLIAGSVDHLANQWGQVIRAATAYSDMHKMPGVDHPGLSSRIDIYETVFKNIVRWGRLLVLD